MAPGLAYAALAGGGLQTLHVALLLEIESRPSAFVSFTLGLSCVFLIVKADPSLVSPFAARSLGAVCGSRVGGSVFALTIRLKDPCVVFRACLSRGRAQSTHAADPRASGRFCAPDGLWHWPATHT
jgi:hypothetical protein